MKQLVFGVMVCLLGCGLDRADGFRSKVPKASEVALEVPGSGSALTGTSTRRDGLEGEQAEFYRLTRGITLAVNGSTAAVLNLVEQITEYPPSTVQTDRAIWGPHTDALSPNTWKLTVVAVANEQDTYSYSLEAKGKTEADAAYRVILSGTHHDQGENYGHGEFLLDFDRAQTLPEHGPELGTVLITYAHPSATTDLTITATLNDVAEGAQRVDATYAYVSTPGQGGRFDYTFSKDFVTGAGIERGTVRSRWDQSGAGRSDVKARGGDLSAEISLSECWDAGFLSRFLSSTIPGAPSWGAQSACRFQTAEYAAL